MTSYRFLAPARVNILGNPSDGNEGDFATLSAAVRIYAGGVIAPANNIELAYLQRVGREEKVVDLRRYPTGTLEFDEDGCFGLIGAAIKRIFSYSDDLQEKYFTKGFRLGIWTDVPRQSGLGGSSLFIVLTLAALRQYYALDPHKLNLYILAELTQRTEEYELGITCGYADRYVPIFGGLGYIDYREKLIHRRLGEEPLATYERLDSFTGDLPLVAVSTGVERDSGDVHGRMRPKYLEEYATYSQSSETKPKMLQFMEGIYETAWRGKIALLENDLVRFGALMNLNHGLVDEMMTYCGFTDGAGWANNLFIRAALENGALGAKLTGAGSGGSVFALVMPGDEERMMRLWRKTAQKYGLRNAHVYRLRIDRRGLRMLRAS